MPTSCANINTTTGGNFYIEVVMFISIKSVFQDQASVYGELKLKHSPRAQPTLQSNTSVECAVRLTKEEERGEKGKSVEVLNLNLVIAQGCWEGSRHL